MINVMTGEEIIQLQDLFKWAVISEDDGGYLLVNEQSDLESKFVRRQ